MINDPYPLPDPLECCDQAFADLDRYVDHQLDVHHAGEVKTS